MIIIVKTDFSGDFESEYRKYIKYVTPERAAKTERIRSEKDKILSLLAGLVIRLRTTEVTGINGDDIVLEYGSHGKPFLKGKSDFYFSVSHSGNYVAFISDCVPVGIDIESRKRGNEKIAKRFFTENEYRKIYEECSADFSEVWTAKEAYIKMTGNGLSQGLNTFDVLDGTTGCRFTTYNLKDDYTVTVCSEKSSEKYFITEMSEKELLSKFT